MKFFITRGLLGSRFLGAIFDNYTTIELTSQFSCSTLRNSMRAALAMGFPRSLTWGQSARRRIIKRTQEASYAARFSRSDVHPHEATYERDLHSFPQAPMN